MTRKQAYEELKNLTEQYFCYDIEKWETFLSKKENSSIKLLQRQLRRNGQPLPSSKSASASSPAMPDADQHGPSRHAAEDVVLRSASVREKGLS